MPRVKGSSKKNLIEMHIGLFSLKMPKDEGYLEVAKDALQVIEREMKFTKKKESA